MIVWLAILVRIVANPFSNVFQKRLTQQGMSPLAVVCVTHFWLAAVCLPIVVSAAPTLSAEFWRNMAISACFTVSGNVLIVQAMKLSDLSLLGPINAYKAVVSLVPGMIWLGEFPGTLGLGGIGLIVVGSYFVVDKNLAEPRRNAFVRFFQERGVQYRFAALVLSAVEAVFFKRALLASSPQVAFAFWSLLGFVSSFVGLFVLTERPARKADIAVLRSNRGVCFWLVLTTGLMQLSTSYVLADLQVGLALALFQISTLLSVILGRMLFQERHFLERLFGSLVMISGAVLVIMSR